MKNKLYLLASVVAIGFTSCQKAQYATFQESQSETFERTPKAAPVVATSAEAANQIHAFSIKTNNSSNVTVDEPTEVATVTEVASVEKVAAPVAVTSKATAPVAATAKVSLKDKLIAKVVAKKINKLNKKAEKSSTSAAVAVSNLLYLGLGIIAIGLLLLLIPGINVLSGVVVAVGAVIAILGIIRRL